MGEGTADEEFFRFSRDDAGWLFEVAVVEWDGPYTTSLRWVRFRRWRNEPSGEKVAAARAAARRRYWRRCIRCGEFANLGHMHDRETCMSCAERVLGIVH